MCGDIPLREGTDLHAHSLNGCDDAEAFGKHCFENSPHGLSAHSLRILEGYVNTNLSLVLKIKAPFGAGVWDLVFCAIPIKRIEELNTGSPGFSESPYFASNSSAGHQHNERVFTGITHVVEGVEKVIPSSVTIETAKERLDFRRRILRNTPHAVIEIGGGFGKRKGGEVGIGLSSCGKDRVIETSPEMLDNFGNKQAPVGWKAFGNLNLMGDVNPIRIKINHGSVWLFSEKLVHLGIEVVEMFVCSREPEPCAKQGALNGL